MAAIIPLDSKLHSIVLNWQRSWILHGMLAHTTDKAQQKPQCTSVEGRSRPSKAPRSSSSSSYNYTFGIARVVACCTGLKDTASPRYLSSHVGAGQRPNRLPHTSEYLPQDPSRHSYLVSKAPSYREHEAHVRCDSVLVHEMRVVTAITGKCKHGISFGTRVEGSHSHTCAQPCVAALGCRSSFACEVPWS